MTTTTETLRFLDHDLADRARDLVKNALKRSNLTPAELRAVLEPGRQLAVYGGEQSLWPTETARDRALGAAGRLLMRLHHEVYVPYESLLGPDVISVATELLQ